MLEFKVTQCHAEETILNIQKNNSCFSQNTMSFTEDKDIDTGKLKSIGSFLGSVKQK